MSITTVHGVAPPTNGSISLPETIDFHRENNPNLPIYVFDDAQGAGGLTEITYFEFGRACDRVAHRLQPERRGRYREVVAIIALSSSLLYQTIVLGIMRAGLIPYPISPRNTAEATVKLLKDSSCHRVLATRETLVSLLDGIRLQLANSDPTFALSIEEAPSLTEIYPKLGHEKPTDPFQPYPTGPPPSPDDILIYFHSSGSTGFPKSVAQTSQTILQWSLRPAVTDFRDHHRLQTIAAQLLPPFHAFGFVTHLLTPLYGLAIIGLYPPTVVAQPSSHNLIESSRRLNCTALFAVPTSLQLWSLDHDVIKYLITLDLVIFGGGLLPTSIGNCLVEAGVHLTSLYGGTEFGPSTHCFKEREIKKDWEYMKFSENMQIRWEDQGDGTYEAQYLTCETHRLAVENLLDVKGYASSDLWVPHPKRAGYWKLVGRKDDVIIHSSGEKTVPAPMESILTSSPYVMGAIMFGSKRDHAGVLIELKKEYLIDVNNDMEVTRTRNLIWPVVEEANKVAPAFSRVYKELVLFVSRDKPLPRSGKGTVMRKAVLETYSAEIRKVYTKVETTLKVEKSDLNPLVSLSHEDIEAWLLSQLTDLGLHGNMTQDFFEMGLDSLGATILRHRIVTGLTTFFMTRSQPKNRRSISEVVTPIIIYDYPSISKLAQFLVTAFTFSDSQDLPMAHARNVHDIEGMIRKYGHFVEDNSTAVLVTGTTGNLGSHLLNALLRDDRVHRVYALNRPRIGRDVKKEHEERFADKGLDARLLSDNRLVFLAGDTSDVNLGLSPEVYQELLYRVTIIIHNAWKVDFNLSLSSFETNIRGTRRLVDLARFSRHSLSVKYLFASSVGTAASWDVSKGPFPEETILDANLAVGTGYGESKYVCERILASSGLQSTSFRIGQISGGVPNGAWSSTDWVPILIKSSIALGALPSAVGTVSWLPGPAVARILLDVALSPGRLTDQAMNVVHPRPVPWDYVMATVNEALVQEGVLQRPLPLIRFSKWFDRLESTDASVANINDIPAIKLLEFFRDLVRGDELLRPQSLEHLEAGWVSKLLTENSAHMSATTSSHNMDDAASSWFGYLKSTGLRLFELFRNLIQGDEVPRRQTLEHIEAGGMPKFLIGKTLDMSATMRDLPCLSGEDAVMWIRYWKRVGLF